MVVTAYIAHPCFSLFFCVSCLQGVIFNMNHLHHFLSTSTDVYPLLAQACATTCQGCTNSIPNQVMSLKIAVRTSQGLHEDVSGETQLATAGRAACRIIIVETVRTQRGYVPENKMANQQRQHVDCDASAYSVDCTLVNIV